MGLISPPPHHDIYSIEDLAQLIHDLKNANPRARIHVKLVSEVGVGTVAAGVSKAHADVVLISGHDGGTGASPLTSLKHAGGPWELGLAETQQTLLLNGLRDRIVVQTDGQLKTGRDVVIAALLGAEEFGFATAPLVVSGCIMMRVCHLDTCPVGVATQNPVLRERYTGKPEFVVNFFEYIAEEVRELLAELGFRTLDEAIGQVDALDVAPRRRPLEGRRARPDADPAPARAARGRGRGTTPPARTTGSTRRSTTSWSPLAAGRAGAGRAGAGPARDPQRQPHRRHDPRPRGHQALPGEGLPDGTIDITFTGSAGQSFGAFLPARHHAAARGRRQRLRRQGPLRRPDRGPPRPGGDVRRRASRSSPATSSATAPPRARSSCAARWASGSASATPVPLAVVEGVGDHGCEYMTGGRVVVLGPTGRNFAAGMSGGYAFVLDLDEGRVNPELVELGPVEGEAADELEALVTRHAEETGSAGRRGAAGRLGRRRCRGSPR